MNNWQMKSVRMKAGTTNGWMNEDLKDEEKDEWRSEEWTEGWMKVGMIHGPKGEGGME